MTAMALGKQMLRCLLSPSYQCSSLLDSDLILLPRLLCQLEDARHLTTWAAKLSFSFPFPPSFPHSFFLPVFLKQCGHFPRSVMLQKMKLEQKATLMKICLLPLGGSVSMAFSPLLSYLLGGAPTEKEFILSIFE